MVSHRAAEATVSVSLLKSVCVFGFAYVVKMYLCWILYSRRYFWSGLSAAYFLGGGKWIARVDLWEQGSTTAKFWTQKLSECRLYVSQCLRRCIDPKAADTRGHVVSVCALTSRRICDNPGEMIFCLHVCLVNSLIPLWGEQGVESAWWNSDKEKAGVYGCDSATSHELWDWQSVPSAVSRSTLINLPVTQPSPSQPLLFWDNLLKSSLFLRLNSTILLLLSFV